MKIREKFNALSHFAGSVFAIYGLAGLMVKSTTLEKKIATLIFSISMFSMFFSSALYHSVNANDKVIKTLRKLDHVMIGVFIAGTYTPLCMISLKESKAGMIFLIVIWSLAIVSAIQSFFWIDAPRWFSTGIYLLMGWVAIFGIKYVYYALSFKGFLWLMIGGTFYTVGAIIYALKKPDFGKILGFHEIWHLFVLAGAISHYIMIYSYVY
ncbi:PAQR family membrane homeostasis protein TrhA [Thermotomaculum hydrothermale]|nr:hemolysin III family protein [Thermotomaculum hydrothermale]